MTNIIFGVYNGYSSLKTSKGGLYYFMKSLRKYNQTCKVVIVCERCNIFNELVEFSKEMDFEIYSDFNVEYQMMYYRFLIYKKYLEQTTYKIDKILLADLNDVIFQENPFSIQFTEDIYCALEGSILNDRNNGSSCLNMDWINEASHFPYVNSENYKGQYIICAGTILGSYFGITNYLDFYKEAQKNRIINDQGLINVYVYNYLSCKNTTEYTKSKILTLDRIKFDSLNIIDKSIFNNKGEKYSIIHQIDRCGIDNLNFILSLVE